MDHNSLQRNSRNFASLEELIIATLHYVRVFVRDGLIWRRHSQQLKSRVRAKALDLDDDDLSFPSFSRSNDDTTNVPEIIAEEQNEPVQRRSVRARRRPERLNYDVLGGRN